MFEVCSYEICSAGLNPTKPQNSQYCPYQYSTGSEQERYPISMATRPEPPVSVDSSSSAESDDIPVQRFFLQPPTPLNDEFQPLEDLLEPEEPAFQTDSEFELDDDENNQNGVPEVEPVLYKN
jgi:hypothetical protein